MNVLQKLMARRFDLNKKNLEGNCTTQQFENNLENALDTISHLLK